MWELCERLGPIEGKKHWDLYCASHNMHEPKKTLAEEIEAMQTEATFRTEAEDYEPKPVTNYEEESNRDTVSDACQQLRARHIHQHALKFMKSTAAFMGEQTDCPVTKALMSYTDMENHNNLDLKSIVGRLRLENLMDRQVITDMDCMIINYSRHTKKV